ncbi:MAG TPA: DNA polymerase III subunit delta [Clostridiales bacterium]|nr:DNA polymerase III subunit delta [Clostridiales bacterium]
MSIDILKTQLKNNNIKSLYLFYGPEEFLKKFYIKSIEDQIVDKNMAALNKVTLADKVDVQKIIDNCDTLPVFSERKLVIVKNSGLFKGGSGGSEGKKGGRNGDALLDYIKNIPSYTCLIFYEDEIDGRLKVSKEIKSQGLVVEFPYQKPVDLVKWVYKVSKTYKKEIDAEAAALLVEGCESGMTGILNEIEKLVAYTGDRNNITLEDVKKVSSATVKSIIFDLTNAIVEKDMAASLKLLDDMIVLKEPAPKIIFMIARQFRQMLQVKILLESGNSPKEISSRLKLQPFIVEKLRKISANFNIKRLKENMEEIFECDLAIKTGKMKDRTAVELLIAKLTI